LSARSPPSLGGLGEAARVDLHGVLVDAQHLLDRPLDLDVGLLAEVLEAQPPVAIEQIERRPVVIAERPPDGELVVDDDRVADVQLGHRVAHVVEVVLERELRRVRADHDEPAVAIAVGPRADVRQRPQPVDARVRPEVDGDDVTAQAVGGQRLGIQPHGPAVELRERGHVRTVAECALRE
jgi:hypothetical protein